MPLSPDRLDERARCAACARVRLHQPGDVRGPNADAWDAGVMAVLTAIEAGEDPRPARG